MLATALSALLAVVLLAVAKDFAKIVRDGIRPFFSPLREVPGPKSSHWFFGNVKEVMRSGPSEMQERWAQEHGPIVKYKAFLNADRLFIMDLRAIGHVLANSHQYAKPGMIRQFMTKILGGEGLIVVEGETHKRQRRVMNPAFGASQIRALGETFMDKALELREVWLQNLHSNHFQAKPGAPESGRVEVVSWFSRATLDIIGLAGFGYDFESLGGTNKDSDELSKAMRALLSPGRQGSFLAILHNIFPATRIIPTKGDLEIKAARKVIQRVGKQFLEDRKLAVRTSNLDNKVERKDFQDRDLLTLLVRANMASDLPESARMTDDEVLAQMSTFLFAGHETTATALSWLIHALSLHPLVQDKLRAELQSCPAGDRPSTDILGNLKYLDAVIRESMRIYSPAPSTLREALEDDIVPTGKEWVDRNGIKRREIPISKGDTIFISMISVNQSKDIWGEDAMEFKPERWLSELPPSAASIPGIWNGSMTFGGGARACIGWRFSLFEMKAVAYTLVRSFRFEQAVPVDDIIKKSTAVMRPYLKDRLEEGPQLPVWVTAIADSSI